MSEQERNVKTQATIRRCGEYDKEAPEEIRDHVKRIICWEAFKFREEYQGYGKNKNIKRKRRKRR